jgi:flagellar biosynthesis protein FliQ
MTEAEALDIIRDALYATVIISLPLMMIALIVGVAISLFQALTQLQEQTLTFVPKILLMLVAMVFLLPFMHGHLKALTEGLMDKIIAVGLSRTEGGGAE